MLIRNLIHNFCMYEFVSKSIVYQIQLVWLYFFSVFQFSRFLLFKWRTKSHTSHFQFHFERCQPFSSCEFFHIYSFCGQLTFPFAVRGFWWWIKVSQVLKDLPYILTIKSQWIIITKVNFCECRLVSIKFQSNVGFNSAWW